MKQLMIAAVGLVALVLGCSPPGDQEAAKQPGAGAAQAIEESTCPDDGPRLAVTNICAGRAANYLDPNVLMTSEVLPEGCEWVINDARMGSDDEAILYQAVRCKGKTTQLELRAGAGSGALGYVESGFYENLPSDFEPVRIFTIEGRADPKAWFLDMAKKTTENKAEAAACEIQPFNPPGSTVLTDAFVFDVNAAYKKAKGVAAGEVHPACGPFGIADGNRYWIIRQGYAWFVDFGQDSLDFNPNSILRMKREAGGAWVAIP